MASSDGTGHDSYELRRRFQAEVNRIPIPASLRAELSIPVLILQGGKRGGFAAPTHAESSPCRTRLEHMSTMGSGGMAGWLQER